MECSDFTRQLDEYLDGRLDVTRQGAMQAHLEACLACRRRHERSAALLAALRALPAPAPRPGFLDEALSRAAANGERGLRRHPLIGMALAASLVLGVALGVFFATQPPPVQTVTLALEQPETVRLVFHSAQPLSAAKMHLTLPRNIELVGYGGRRELAWQTDLREGANLLQLPLIAHGAAKGELVARLSHGEASKTFRVKVQVKPQGGMS
jgi:hypothetical protein